MLGSHYRAYVLGRKLPKHLRKLVWQNGLHTNCENRLHIAESASIGKNVKLLSSGDISANDEAHFYIGENAFIGDEVELGITPNSILKIGKNTSMHKGTVILGNVQIGSYCIFSYNIFIASGNHVTNLNPTWLIKDQDDKYLISQPKERVVIEDDVWLGWGVFIKSGVYIGKGAIIGANSVVTKNIEPYSIYAGSPARQLGQRLDFKPPAAITAIQDDHLPYFYSGFNNDQASLSESRHFQSIWTGKHSIAVLKGTSSYLRIVGINVKKGNVKITIEVNQEEISSFEIQPGRFEKVLTINASRKFAESIYPDFFDDCLLIKLMHDGEPLNHIGIESISLL